MEEFENLVYEILDLFYLPHQISKQFQDLKHLQNFGSLAEVIKLLQHRRLPEEVMYGETLPERETASKCLQTLLFIWATIQESGKERTDSLKEETDVLYELNTFLHGSRHIWANSENDVYSLIWDDLAKRKENQQITLFVMVMAESLRNISPRALRGVEQCLLGYWCESGV